MALSFAGEQRALVRAVAEALAAELGEDRVFFDDFWESELARPDLDLYLLEIYRSQSDLVVFFFGKDYASKQWCRLEWRAIRALIHELESERVMPIRAADVDVDADLPGLLPIDGWVGAGKRPATDLAALILERLGHVPAEATAPQAPLPSAPALEPPGLFRHLLDRYAPKLHSGLTNAGTLPKPREQAALRAYLGELRTSIQRDIAQKTYLALRARSAPSSPLDDTDPFRDPIRQVLRQIAGLDQGGDAASAPIAAVNRRSRLVRNIVRLLLEATAPLVLLGEPGSGKTMTLQQALLRLIESEEQRVFPLVPLFVRLGEFHVPGRVTPDRVLDHVRASSPESVRPWLESLDRAGRLVLVFDGMDEMSRDRYNEHAAALSDFAEARSSPLYLPLLTRPTTKTLFSCRIADFSPAFLHQRLVLLPFDLSQIQEYLRSYLGRGRVAIDGEAWSHRRLARYLVQGELPFDATNPFVLWLLCIYLQHEGSWPGSRVELLRFHVEKVHERKAKEGRDEGHELPDLDACIRGWSRFAYTITARNRGAAIPVELLMGIGEGDREAVAALIAAGKREAVEALIAAGKREEVEALIAAGKRCTVLAESTQRHQHQIRFDHHRFQEYFTALHLHGESEPPPPVDWLEVLDAPRWQETMLNLVELGSGDEAIGVFVEAVAPRLAELRERFADYDRELERWNEEQAKRKEQRTGSPRTSQPKEEGPQPPTIPDDDEAQLADRIEHGARMLRQGRAESVVLRERLRPCVVAGVELLAKRGNPITQVKTMRACQHLRDLDVLQALAGPLRSPVNWVRDQALVLVSARRAAAQAGSDLGSEIGFDFANGVFLSRLGAYFRAVRAARDPNAWRCFLVGTALSLVELGLLAIVVAGLYHAVALYLIHPPEKAAEPVKAFCRLFAPFHAAWSMKTAYVAGATGAGVLVTRNGMAATWGAALLGATAVGAIAASCVGLWHGHWTALPLPLLFLVFLIGVLLLAAEVGVPLHLGLVGLYGRVTRRNRGATHSMRSFLKAAWSNHEDVFVAASGMWGTAAAFGAIYGFSFVSRWAAGVVGMPYQVVVSELAFASWLCVAGYPAGALVWGRIAHQPRRGSQLAAWSTAVLVPLGALLLLLNLGWPTVASLFSALGAALWHVWEVVGGWHRSALTWLGLYVEDWSEFALFIALFSSLMVTMGLFEEPDRSRKSAKRALALGPTVAVLVWLALHLLGFVVRVLWGACSAWLSGLSELLGGHSDLFARALSIALALALLLVAFWLLHRLWKSLRVSWTLYLYPPGYFTEADWKSLLHRAAPFAQQEILLRTTPQSLSLSPAEFLGTLQAVRNDVKEEPALSAYWNRRDEIEQALRQERSG